MQDRHRRIVEIFLLRTAGPYIWVIRDRVEPSAGQAMSALPRKPTRQCIAGKCRDVPISDLCTAANSDYLRCPPISPTVIGSRGVSGCCTSKFIFRFARAGLLHTAPLK